jgi:hypothetical protein
MFSRGSPGNGIRYTHEEDTMTEQPDKPPRPGEDDEGSSAGVGKDAARPGGGRTEGETAVDDQLGQGTPPER